MTRRWNLEENRDIEGALQCAVSQVRVALRVSQDDPERQAAYVEYRKVMVAIHDAIETVRAADIADASKEPVIA